MGRRWRTGGEALLVVGLNPSTADGRVDDPTTRRCLGFAQDWGFHALWMGNLYAYRATDPRALDEVVDPEGASNQWFVDAAASRAGRVLFAWGNRGQGERADRLLARWPGWHLGRTALGAPRHPLYVARSAVPQRWMPEEER